MNDAVFVMRLLVVLFLWLLSFPALAFEAKVIGVQDGDTITVLKDREPIKVRLHGIDAPEKKQPFGTRARQFTSDLVFSKTVRIEGEKKDRYGRLLVVVILADGRYLNEEIVYEGYAWWYRQYAPGDKVLEGLEDDARQHKRGLWADNQPVPPWEWRKGRLSKTPVGLANRPR